MTKKNIDENTNGRIIGGLKFLINCNIWFQENV